jgi:AraC-like DNA-binding protein
VLDTISSDLAGAEVADFAPLLRRSLSRIEVGPDPLHHTTLGLMLVDLCGQIVQAVHARQPSVSCSCYRVAWEHARALSRVDHGNPLGAFQEWLDPFLAHASAAHPSTPADRAASRLRADPGRAWTLGALADAVGADSVRLSRQFKGVFGLRPAEYLHLVRVSRAVAMLQTATKVDVLALEIGYRSKKDFYAALKRWTGLTPTELRALRNDESEWLRQELRQRCLRSGEASAARPIFEFDGVRAPAGRPACRQPRRRRLSTQRPNR